MSVLKYFKNTPGRPHRATGPKCNFFFKFATRSLKKKGLSPPLGRPLGPAHGRGRGACRPPSGDRGNPLIFDPTPLPSSFEPENSTKDPEKKER